MSVKWLACLVVLGVACSVGACRQREAPGHAAIIPELTDALAGKDRNELLGGHFRTCRFKDTLDAGNDEFVAGCHVHYDRDPQCAGNPNFNEGDSCIDGTNLSEWTNTACHPDRPLDKTPHDCDAKCKARGAAAGVCAAVAINCLGAQRQSARCECIPQPVPPNPTS